MTGLADGLHALPAMEYERIDAMRCSILKFFDRSAAHARSAMLEPSEPTPVLTLGQAVHAAILEPELFDQEYIAAPKFDRRFKAQKAEWEAFEAAHAHHTILREEEYEQCLRIRDAVWSHTTAANLLQERGRKEVTVLWTDTATKVRCKARVDLLLASGVVLDLKTTRDAEMRAFERDVVRYLYFVQAGWYMEGLERISPRPAERTWIFLAVEKEPPYASALYELSPASVEEGRRRAHGFLAQYARCVETGVWPGYPPEIRQIILPDWSFRADDELEEVA